MLDKFSSVYVCNDEIKIMDGYVLINNIIGIMRNNIVKMFENQANDMVLLYFMNKRIGYLEKVEDFDKYVNEDYFEEIYQLDDINFKMMDDFGIYHSVQFKRIKDYDINQVDPTRVANVKMTFNRNKILDEAVFLGLCGLTQCREGFAITGIVRLQMAVDGMNKAIKFFDKDKNSFKASTEFTEPIKGEDSEK